MKDTGEGGVCVGQRGFDEMVSLSSEEGIDIRDLM